MDMAGSIDGIFARKRSHQIHDRLLLVAVQALEISYKAQIPYISSVGFDRRRPRAGWKEFANVHAQSFRDQPQLRA